MRENLWLVLQLVLLATAGLVYFYKKEHRKEMLMTILFAVPVLFVIPLIEQGLASKGIVWYFYRIFSILSYTSFASVIYLLVFRRHISPIQNPLRKKLGWLVVGIIVALILRYFFALNFALAILIGLFINLAIVLILRSDLIWDFLFSSIVMGVFYLVLFKLSHLNLAVSQMGYWFTGGVTGITVWSVPIEELLLAFVLGGMLGPIYLAVKDQADVQDVNIKYINKPKKVVSLILSVLLLSAVAFFLRIMVLSPSLVQAQEVVSGQNTIDLNQELKFDFDYPVNRKEIIYQISPTVEGEWFFEDNLIKKHFFKTLTFRPEGVYQPNQEYTVEIKNVSNVFGRGAKNYTQKFTAKGLPTVAEASVKDGEKDYNICGQITVNLDQANLGFAQFSFAITPETELEVVENANKKEYLLKPKQCLQQGTNYSLKVERELVIRNLGGDVTQVNPPEQVYLANFTTKNSPNIASYSPKGGAVLVDEKVISISFTENMASGAVGDLVSISPSIDGVWNWVDAKNLRFVSSGNLLYGTNYSIKISKGLKDVLGGYLPSDVTLGFSTIGRVKISSNWPANGAVGVAANARIKMQFNQEVDHISAESLFVIYPSKEGAFSWEGTTLYFSPNGGFEKNSSYSASLQAGVKSIKGLDSDTGYKINFETEISTTMLNIAYDHQDRALSCELASLKMALNYRGLGVSENELINAVGFDPTERNGNVWGDPDQAFVGSIDGKQNSTGYGVHWDPIRSVAGMYRGSSVLSGQPSTAISKEIERDNPVVIWGSMGAGKADQWTTPSGKVINTIIGEHVRLVIGYTGRADNPLSFIINDPIVGRIKWSRSQFDNNWSVFGNKGVVVY